MQIESRGPGGKCFFFPWKTHSLEIYCGDLNLLSLWVSSTITVRKVSWLLPRLQYPFETDLFLKSTAETYPALSAQRQKTQICPPKRHLRLWKQSTSGINCEMVFNVQYHCLIFALRWRAASCNVITATESLECGAKLIIYSGPFFPM